MRQVSRAPRFLLALVVLLTLLPALAFAPVARAADPCVVTSGADSGAGTLRAALDTVANGGCGVGTITFALPTPQPWTIGVTSLLRIDRPLVVSGPGMDKLTIRYAGSSTSQGSVFIITATPVAVRDLTIADGRTSGSLYGAGVRIAPSAQRVVDVTLERVRVSRNQTATNGGGVYATNANLTVTDSIIEGNTAGEDGGGLYLSDITGPIVATLTNTVVAGNTAASNGGGGVLVRLQREAPLPALTLALTNTIVSGNKAASGGGLYASGGTGNYDHTGSVTLTDSSVTGNQTVASTAASAGSGGGIYATGTTLALVNSTVATNTGKDGGGIAVSGFGAATLTNSTVVGNTATAQGGGIVGLVASNVTLTAVTLVDNRAASGGAGVSVAPAAYYKPGGRFERTIIAGNQVNGAPGDCATAAGDTLLTSGGYNLVGSGGGCPTTATDVTLTGTLAGVVAPALADNGGPTQTRNLVAGSPALDRIPLNRCTLAKDQRGVIRPQNGLCDIGAVEYTPTPPSPAPTASPSASPSPSSSPSAGPAPSFADVPPGYWAHDQIVTFAQRGITTGCGDNDQGQRIFCPERGVTRAEMATFLTRALGQQNQTPPATPTFADVPTDYWAYSAIEAFVKLGITTGCGTDEQGRRIFCPDRGVTRAEMAAFLDRAKSQAELANPVPTFADVPPSYWAYGWIERFFTLGVTTGCGTDDQGHKVYCPDRGVTRAEMAVFIIRAYP